MGRAFFYESSDTCQGLSGPGRTNERIHKVACSLLPEYFALSKYVDHSLVMKLTESAEWTAFLIDLDVVVVEPVVSCDEVYHC